jgi:hypothetical protein
MTYETVTAATPDDTIARAKAFFTRRIPAMAAFAEREGPGFVVLRGQGGEEVVFNARAGSGGTSLRGSSMLYGQQIKRFFTTLPPAAESTA